jgi:ketosteroid isomerase-like protein
MRYRGRALWILAAVAAAATAAATLARAADAEKAVLAAEDQRFAATVGADIPTLERMLTDDMTYTHATAAVDTKAELLAKLKDGTYDYKSITPEERTVRMYGDAAAVAGVAHVLVHAGGRDIDVRLRYAELYVKQDGAWRLALWHSTRVP